jgi:tripartite-type tricarboxylate transporter receptor subunit TctC
MIPTRRRLLLGIAAAVGPGAAPAWAQADFPTRPIRTVIGFAPGGGVDLVARPLAQRMSRTLGQTIVVESRAGANGNIAADHVAFQVPADGYTLLQINGAMATNNPFLYRNVRVTYRRDFAPICGITSTPQAVMVSSTLGVSTLADLVGYARANPGKLNFASGGIGTLAHLSLELFKRDQQIDIVHVPYRGTGPAIPDMIAGRMHLMIDNLAQARGAIDAGQMRVLAVAGHERLSAIPDVPTTIEAGFPNLVAVGWQALMAPATVPAPVLARLREACREAMSDEELLTFYRERGVVPRYRTPQEVSELIRDESAQWGEIIRSAGITLE